MYNENFQETPIFIVSTGRCGSTLATKILGNHPDALSISEFWPNRINLKELFSNQYMSGQEFWEILSVPMAEDMYTVALTHKTQVSSSNLKETNYIKRITLPSLVEDYNSLFYDLQEYVRSLPRQSTSDHILDTFNFMRVKLNKKVWVERTGASLDFLPAWKKIFPNAKYIHIHRDGRNCAISMSKHPAFKLQVIRTEENPENNFYNIIPVKEDIYNNENFDAREIPLHKFGELWNDMLVNGMKELKEIPDEQKIEISYENLIAEPEKYLTLLINFIDPSIYNENWIEEQKAQLFQSKSRWEELDDDVKQNLNEACAEGLALLNYL